MHAARSIEGGVGLMMVGVAPPMVTNPPDGVMALPAGRLDTKPAPRASPATHGAPKAPIGTHVIFAFRFQNERARVFFWGQNELAQFSSEGGFELALFFSWADFGFFLGPFRASSVSWLYSPGPT